jgi:hypothetical protein
MTDWNNSPEAFFVKIILKNQQSFRIFVAGETGAAYKSTGSSTVTSTVQMFNAPHRDDLRGHPEGAASAFSHDGGHVAGCPKVANL